MSLRENLLREKEGQEKKNEDLAHKLEEERSFANAKAELEEQKKIQTTIEKLQARKDDLKKSLNQAELLINDFSEAYQEAVEKQGEFKENFENLSLIMEEFHEILAKRGIESIDDLASDPQYGEHKESHRYKESAAVRKKAISNLADLKTSRPDLNFRGGKRDGEERSPREIAFETMNLEKDKISKELDLLDNKIESLSSELDESPFEQLTELCREEFEEHFKETSFENNSFSINNEPGPYINYKLLDLAKKYDEEVVKSLLKEKLSSHYYKKPINTIASINQEELINSVDFLWLEADINKITRATNPEDKDLINHLNKKTKLGTDLELLERLDKNKYADLKFKSYKDMTGEMHMSYERDNDGFRKKLQELQEDYVHNMEKKMEEDKKVLDKNKLFISKSKREKSRSRYDFYTRLKDDIKSLNLYTPISSKIITKANELNEAKIVSDQELEGLNSFMRSYQAIVSENEVSINRANAINKEIGGLSDLGVRNLFAIGESVSFTKILNRVRGELENLDTISQNSELGKHEAEFKESFRDFSKLIEKNKRNISRGAFEHVARKFEENFPYDLEISPKLDDLKQVRY